MKFNLKKLESFSVEYGKKLRKNVDMTSEDHADIWLVIDRLMTVGLERKSYNSILLAMNLFREEHAYLRRNHKDDIRVFSRNLSYLKNAFDNIDDMDYYKMSDKYDSRQTQMFFWLEVRDMWEKMIVPVDDMIGLVIEAEY